MISLQRIAFPQDEQAAEQYFADAPHWWLVVRGLSESRSARVRGHARACMRATVATCVRVHARYQVPPRHTPAAG